MKFIIIGLGNYGRVLAEELTSLNHEVIGADIDGNKVEAIKDKIATAFLLDATDAQSLSVLPVKGVDTVVVSIGENFGASVRVVAMLKKMGVKHIYARAIDEVHRAILEAFSIDRILTPEEDAARNLVETLDFGTKVESFRVDKDYYVVCFRIPKKFIGYHINDLNLYKEFHLRLIGLKRNEVVQNCVGIEFVDKKIKNELPGDALVLEDDELVCYGKYEDFKELWKAI
jgi:trk system potassium uptake protein TrkA